MVAASNSAEIEETYDDVVVGGGEDEELYDDITAPEPITEENYEDMMAPEPITEEFYEDMAPNPDSSYVVMEKKENEENIDEELYVDVDEPIPSISKPPELSKPSNPKSSSSFSRMFQKKQSANTNANQSGKVNLSGNVSYKAPKKTKFEEKYATIEGTNLMIYKSSSDNKRSQDKVPLGDCKLELGSTEAGAGKHAFRLTKGDKKYHFSLKTEVELEEWIGVVKGLVKYAPVEVQGNGKEEKIYQAKEDHIADSDGELTFKRGTYIRVISRDTPEMWVGQIGTEDQVFNEGKIGKFPLSKVELAEDLYI